MERYLNNLTSILDSINHNPELYDELVDYVKKAPVGIRLEFKKKCRHELYKLKKNKLFDLNSFEKMYTFIKRAELGDKFYDKSTNFVFEKIQNELERLPQYYRFEILCFYYPRLGNISDKNLWRYLDTYLEMMPNKFLSI